MSPYNVFHKLRTDTMQLFLNFHLCSMITISFICINIFEKMTLIVITGNICLFTRVLLVPIFFYSIKQKNCATKIY